MAKAKKLPSGNWRVQVYSHTDIINGKEKKRYRSFTASTKKEAEYLAADWKMNKRDEIRNNITLGEACNRFINNRESVLSITTINGYRSIARNRVQNLMHMKIDTITEEDMQKAMNEEAKTLSPKTCKNIKGFLTAVFGAYRPDFNFKVTLPGGKKMDYYTPKKEEIQKLLAIVEGTDMEIPVMFGVYGGMRRGEICALEYADIHGNIISINKSMAVDKSTGKCSIKPPKTSYGTRYIEVPQFVIDKIGEGEGRIVKIHPDLLTHTFVKIVKNNKLNHFRFHDLRHYNASVLHSLGFPDKYIMQRLGWSSSKMLYNIYGHSLEDFEKEMTVKANSYFEELQKNITQNITQK